MISSEVLRSEEQAEGRKAFSKSHFQILLALECFKALYVLSVNRDPPTYNQTDIKRY